MTKYKILKKDGTIASIDKYYIYRKRLGFFWSLIRTEWTLKEAEEYINRDKARRSYVKKKPVFIGYY